MQKTLIVVFVAVVAFIGGVRSIAAQEKAAPKPVSPVVGKWTSQAETPHGKMTVGFEIKIDAKDARKLAGTMAFGEMGQFPLTGEYVDGKLTFKVISGAGEFTFAGKLKDPNTLTGVLSGANGDIALVGTRVVAK